VGFIGQKLRFLYLQPKGSVGILWDSRHVVDFPTPAPDTDTKQIPLLRTTFLGKPQFISLVHPSPVRALPTTRWSLSSSTIYRSTAYAKGATQPESVTRSVSKMLSATISSSWHSDCSWSLDADSPKGSTIPFPEI
jgi:hypothetical protein